MAIQVVRSVRDGRLTRVEVPAPSVAGGTVVIANRASLVSAGTERMAAGLAKKSLLGKAMERPDHVRRVLEKLKQEGLFTTLRQVNARLGCGRAAEPVRSRAGWRALRARGLRGAGCDRDAGRAARALCGR